jgi:hypothetical protein
VVAIVFHVSIKIQKSGNGLILPPRVSLVF